MYFFIAGWFVFQPLRENSALRALSSLRGLRGAPEVPSLCRETSVSRTANVGTVGKNGLIKRGNVGMMQDTKLIFNLNTINEKIAKNFKHGYFSICVIKYSKDSDMIFKNVERHASIRACACRSFQEIVVFSILTLFLS